MKFLRRLRVFAVFAFGLIAAAPALRAAPPANDQCSGAITIAGPQSTVMQDTTSATSTGDPNPSCVFQFGNGVWYQYTPPSNGQLEIDTFNSSYDTGLGIYTNGCSNPVLVACNDDDLEQGGAQGWYLVQFTVSANVTYLILAGGSSSATGNLVLNLNFSPDAAPVITANPQSQTVAVGSNVTFTVGANSLLPMSYYWQSNNVPIPGAANSSNYTLVNAPLSASGSQFSCIVSNSYGATPSAPATLQVWDPVQLYHFDFESGLEGFTTNNNYNEGNGLWHVSTVFGNLPGHSPTHSLYYGQDATTNYDTGTANAGVAVSPPLTLSAAPLTLYFNYYIDVEPVGSFASDVAYVEISTNNGSNYTVLESKGAGLTNNTGGAWVTNSVDLSAYASTTALLRFRFDTVDQFLNDTAGWLVDDISIEGLAPATSSPPPAPTITGVALTNSEIYFSWIAATNATYQVQYKTDLNQTNWINVGSPLSNPPMPYSNSVSSDTARFYRLLVTP